MKKITEKFKPNPNSTKNFGSGSPEKGTDESGDKLIEEYCNDLGIDKEDFIDSLKNNSPTSEERMNELKEEITKMIAEHKAKKNEEEMLKQEKENEEYKQRLMKAREKKHNINKARKKAEQKKGYSAGRLARLRRLGKMD